MIISRMDGGLGNQMFQYAYGLYLARRHQAELYLDCGAYDSMPQHGFLLDRFQIEAQVVGAAQTARIPQRYRSSKSRKSLWGWTNLRALRRHKEREFGFRNSYLAVPNNRYLVGYWQSQAFFPGMRSQLILHLTPAQSLSSHSQRVEEQIRNTKSAAIHVRRGDYITDQSAAAIYEQLTLDYYRSSLEAWAASTENVEVFVFSNDMAWCHAQIDWPWKTHWVDHTSAATAHEDLWLMSQAACCIIANSTFSWWSAWLNEREGRVIYAPERWFREGKMDDSQIIPAHWIRTRLSKPRIAA